MSGRLELNRQEQIHRYFPQRSLQGAARARALEAQRRADLVHQEVKEEDMQTRILASLESFAAEELRQARLARHFSDKLEADTAEAICHSLENAEAMAAARRAPSARSGVISD